MATVDTTLARARTHHKKGEFARARELCRDVLQRYPKNSKARALLSRLPESAPSQDLLEKLIAAHKSGHTALVAEQAARLLPIYPDSYVLWQIHGGVLLELGAFQQAEDSLRRAMDLRPDLPEARVNHSVALRALGRSPEAESQSRMALTLAPGHTGAMIELAAAVADRGNLSEAADICKAVIAVQPDTALAHNIVGVAAHEEGRFAEAEAACARAVQIDPEFAEAHRNLAAFKDWKGEDTHLAQMQALYEAPTLSPMNRARICHALFSAWDKMNQPDRAWPFLREGNALRKALAGYDISQDTALFDRLGAQEIAPLQGVGSAPVAPIFILGMPRSGTTLVEQIVSAHSQVKGAGELSLAGDLGRGFLNGAGVTASGLKRFREDYLAGLAEVSEGLPFVTDKMPHNFRLTPLICAALPEARVLHVVRDARSVCWSNLKQYFTAQSLGYCNDPADVVAYHGLYRNWMKRCEQAWPGRVRRLNYGALTSAPETQTRALIADLGLDWEGACLAPQNNPRRVHTASAGQVRDKIHPERPDEWRRYEAWLGEIFAALPEDS